MCVRKKTNTGNVPTIEKRQRLALNVPRLCAGGICKPSVLHTEDKLKKS
jgi:hypothetical protein